MTTPRLALYHLHSRDSHSQASSSHLINGGQFQLLDETGKSYIAPRQRGTIILFDSRAQHRVRPVTKGIRKSIVGWTVGPRWK